mmetsp:Transcript_42239/g.51453  ORF Transcript_42239/g.51453 Transcript_42239/m.51453 type:complete len:271 (-) Transcript_42239:927-1739(-)
MGSLLEDDSEVVVFVAGVTAVLMGSPSRSASSVVADGTELLAFNVVFVFPVFLEGVFVVFVAVVRAVAMGSPSRSVSSALGDMSPAVLAVVTAAAASVGRSVEVVEFSFNVPVSLTDLFLPLRGDVGVVVVVVASCDSLRFFESDFIGLLGLVSLFLATGVLLLGDAAGFVLPPVVFFSGGEAGVFFVVFVAFFVDFSISISTVFPSSGDAGTEALGWWALCIECKQDVTLGSGPFLLILSASSCFHSEISLIALLALPPFILCAARHLI